GRMRMSRRRRTDAILQPTAHVLLRDRFAREDDVRLYPRRRRPGARAPQRAVDAGGVPGDDRAVSGWSGVAAECMFTWYWLADVCAAEGITFGLGHALAMKAIHGGKAKNDRNDCHQIAVLP